MRESPKLQLQNIIPDVTGVKLLAFLSIVLLGSWFSVPLHGRTGKVPQFESDILPIFERECFLCHGNEVKQAELDLSTYKSIIRGGSSGPAVIPGSAEKSLLFEKILLGEMPL